MCPFISELDGMEPWATNIGNAYLEALTSEKVCIRAGPEFGDLEGHLLIIYKALYGLKTSGKTSGQLLQECLLELGFLPSLGEAFYLYEKFSDRWSRSLRVHIHVCGQPCYYNEGPTISYWSTNGSTKHFKANGIRTAQLLSWMLIFS